MKLKLYRLTQRECCPYCKEKSIAFHKIVCAGSMWYNPKCPHCGATIRVERKMRIFKFLAVLIIIVAFVAITIKTDAYLLSFWSSAPLIAVALLDTIIALIADLDYEEFWNYPKPKNDNGDN